MTGSTISSISAAITAPPPSTEPPGPRPFRPGPRSPAWPLGHRPSCDWPSCALSRPEPIKLTVPSFLLREGLHRRMTARFDRELTLWTAVAGAHLLVIATFGVGSCGVPEVEELALMVVTGTWIPIEHIYDSQLVDVLTRTGRRFIKGLRYNLASS